MRKPPTAVVGRASEFVRLYGVREAAVNARARTGIFLAGPGYRKAVSPDMSTMDAAAASTHVHPIDVIRAVAGPEAEGVLAGLEADFERHAAELRQREAERRLVFPPTFGSETAATLVLYGLTRLLRPAVVLETGVADGYSSFAFIRALMDNGEGRLVSLDVRPDVGVLLDDAERERWSLRLVDQAAPKRQLVETLEEVGVVDLFLHDSCHHYRWQMFELTTVLPRVSPGGVIACDDADDSFAFIDFCQAIDNHPVLLVERRKVLGVVRLPALRDDPPCLNAAQSVTGTARDE